MRPFQYTRRHRLSLRRSGLRVKPDAMFLGGGTNLVDLMKMGVERPVALIDITRVPLTSIEEHEGGVRIGAMARNTDAAAIH